MNFALAQTLRPRSELKNAMLRHGYAVNNAGSSARVKKILRNLLGKRGWHLNLKHLVVVEAIFSDVIQLCRAQAVYDLHLYCRPWKIMFPLLQLCVFFVTDGDTLCQNISEFLCSSLAVSLAQTGSCLFILCCLEGLATLAEKIPSLTRWR